MCWKRVPEGRCSNLKTPSAELSSGARNQHLAASSRTQVCPTRDVWSRRADVLEVCRASATDTVEGVWCLPSVLWHCCLGHLTGKNPSPTWPRWDVNLNLALSVYLWYGAKRTSIACTILAWLTSVTDRQTDKYSRSKQWRDRLPTLEGTCTTPPPLPPFLSRIL